MGKKKYNYELVKAEEKNKVQLSLMLLSLFLYLYNVLTVSYLPSRRITLTVW
jgi:hypothetical protein